MAHEETRTRPPLAPKATFGPGDGLNVDIGCDTVDRDAGGHERDAGDAATVPSGRRAIAR